MVYLLKNKHYFHTSNNINSKATKVMGKIMGMNKKKKNFMYNGSPLLPSTSLFDKTPITTKITGNPKRTHVLNKLFMRHITDLMATGEYSSQLFGYGIEVNKVKITTDYKILRVYWVSKESSDDNAVEQLLKKNAGSLTHELSQLRVMGRVPNITFIKDKEYFKVLEVEKKLAVADFGEDHISTDLADELKTEPELWTVLDSEFKSKIEKLDAEEEDSEIDSTPPPKMPQNVLGLDHAQILSHILKGKKAAEGAHRKMQSDSADNFVEKVDEIQAQCVSQEDQRQALRQFLRSREILKDKLRKGEKNWTTDQEYLLSQQKQMFLQNLQALDEEMCEEDYVPEYDEEPEKT